MDQVNTLRIHAGLPPLSEYENRLHVTNAKAGESAHQYGLALDVVPLVGGKCVWENSSPVWKDIVAIAESVGLESASKWKTFKEWPHLQYLGGLSIDDLRNGKRPV
jgi:peptidoglycan L-alanyl-D-glutamate endopeptidase CwlK